MAPTPDGRSAPGGTVDLLALPDVSIGEVVAFVAVLKCRSFTGAARELHLSQPGLSARISRLERSLGAVLIDRSRRDLTLTSAGAGFAPIARELLRLLMPAGSLKDGPLPGRLSQRPPDRRDRRTAPKLVA